MSEIKDLNPLADFLKQVYAPFLTELLNKGSFPGYDGQLSAKSNPMMDFARQAAGRFATSGAPVAWNQAQSMLGGGGPSDFIMQRLMGGGPDPRASQFINQYSQAYPTGWNPYSQMSNQPGYTGVPPWMQGGGMPPWAGGGG